MATHDEWRKAYARQAEADLSARTCLIESGRLPRCQELHFLQMACEKICKAYLCGDGVDPATLARSHAYIAGVLPVIFQRWCQDARQRWVMSAIRNVARRIELLAPAVDDAGRHPANCEYPWIGPGGNVVAPSDWRFEGLDFMHEPFGIHLMKVLWAAISDLKADDLG